jgi:predicted branched-subunit amino acid permease
MEKTKFEKAVDYFPLIAYGAFWFQGALIGSIVTEDPKLMALGFVTTPAIAAMIAAAVKIRKEHLNSVGDE